MGSFHYPHWIRCWALQLQYLERLVWIKLDCFFPKHIAQGHPKPERTTKILVQNLHNIVWKEVRANFSHHVTKPFDSTSAHFLARPSKQHICRRLYNAITRHTIYQHKSSTRLWNMSAQYVLATRLCNTTSVFDVFLWPFGSKNNLCWQQNSVHTLSLLFSCSFPLFQGDRPLEYQVLRWATQNQ